MAKGKKRGGEHKTPRVNVGFPEPWHAAARRAAAKQRQPVLYLLISLVQEHCRQQGIECPPAPWEEGEEGRP